jgi:hypothetical protein
MPPKRQIEEKPLEEIVEDIIESPQEKLENRIAVLEKMVEKLYKHHFAGFPK